MSEPNEVVISGVGGLFPESDNFEELEANLYNKINMVTKENPRWKPGELGVPYEIGKIKDPHTCDYTLFGIYSKLCAVMETNIRLLLLASFNAICDAGINPKDVSGTKTAVVTSSGLCETEYTCITGHLNLGQGMLGHSKTMEANRISYFLNTKGPSLVINSSWNGGMHALKVAKDLVERGEVPAAIVGASSTTINRAEVSYHFHKMGRLDREGKTKSFSADASGYARSEACVVFLLQRASDAYRSYGSVLDIVCQSNYAMKTDLIMTNAALNVEMIKRLHEESGVDPSEVAYIEGYGGASPKVDALELNTYAEIYTKNRDSPILVGSVSSNLGHCEFAASFVSLAKVLIAMKNGIIPSNLHYSSPNPDVPALLNNKMKIVTDHTPLPGDIVGIGSMGATGDFSYALIKRNPKTKLHKCALGELPRDGVPRLVVMSGRASNGLQNSFEKIIKAPIDEECVDLINKCFARKVNKHLFRGYAVLDGSNDCRQVIEAADDADVKPIWFVFSGMGSQWCGMGKELIRLPIFANAIHKCDTVLKPKGLDIIDIITTENPKIFDNILHSFVGIAAVQIGLVDVMRALGVEPDGLVGHSVGELGCAYADGCFTAEQMILAAYARGKASVEANLIKGMMAAVGKGNSEIKDQLPPSIEVACHNSSASCTLSGPTQDMEVYIDTLKSSGVFAKLVNVSNIAYHSQYIKPAAPALLKYLKETIPAPKKRSKRWISSSIDESNWDSDLAKYSSAEYHTNNLLSAVLFEEASSHIPPKAIVIEIAPHGLMQSIIKKSLASCAHIPLTNRYDKDGLKFLLNAIGKMFIHGITMDTSKLYPPVEYPVSRETPFIHPLITWDKSNSFEIQLDFMSTLAEDSPYFRQIELQITDNQWTTNKRFIHSRNIIPLAFYLDSVKNFYETKEQSNYYLVMEDIRVSKILEIREELKKQMEIVLQRGTGNFEITTSGYPGEIIAAGKVSYKDVVMYKDTPADDKVKSVNAKAVARKQIYDRLKQFGYSMDESLHHIKQFRVAENYFEAVVEWTGDFANFLESVLTLIVFDSSVKHNLFHVISFVKQICIDRKCFQKEPKDIHVHFNNLTNLLSCEGLNIHRVVTEPCQINPLNENYLRRPFFYPFTGFNFKDETDFLCASLNIVIENLRHLETVKNKIAKLSIICVKTDPLIVAGIQNVIHFRDDLEVRFLSTTTNGGLYLETENFGSEAVLLVAGKGQAEKIALEIEEDNVPFVLAEHDEEVLKMKALTVISDCKLGNKRYLLLKRGENNKDKPVHIINTTETNWLEKLEGTATQALRVCLVKPFVLFNEIFDVLNVLERMDSRPAIQCFFVDDKSPSFSLRNAYYSNQLKKNLKINISKDGQWGTLTYTQYKNVANSPRANRIFKMTSIKNPDLKIASIGLNSTNNTSKGQENQEILFGTVEFSGTSTRSGGSVMGLGSLTEMNNLHADDVLIWEKPKKWSHDEASTVLTAYTMASYIQYLIEENSEGIMKKVAIIHRGLLPLSQAIINLLSAASWRIITTYNTEEEKIKLKKLYPTLNEDQIFGYGKHEFYARVRALYESGVAVVVNTIENQDLFIYSIKCLQKKGLIFQVNDGFSEEKYRKIGMLPFLTEAVMLGISGRVLLGLPVHIKCNVREKVQNAIHMGIAKPFKYRTIPSSELNFQVAATVGVNKVEDETFVVSFMNDSAPEQDIFTCDPEKAYLILGETSNHYLKVLDYLVVRGAKTIFTDLNSSALIGLTEERLIPIVNEHPDIEINFISNKKLRSKNSISQFIKEIETSSEIGGLFLVGMEINELATLFDEALKHADVQCLMACIGNGGEATCHRRKIRGVPAVCARCNLKTITSNALVYNLDLMLHAKTLEKSFLEIRENFPIHTIESSGMGTWHLPKDLSELLLFKNLKKEKACFVELQTASPRYHYTKEIDPIFLIPGFRHADMHEFVKQMFYPVFEARLPARIQSVEQVAETLCQEIHKFDLSVITLVADTCGGLLAFQLANYLEADGKKVSLILLNAAPHNIKKWLGNELKLGNQKLLKKYARVPLKENQFESNYGKFTVTSTGSSASLIDDVQGVIQMIRDYEDALLKSNDENMFAGQCTYIRPSPADETNEDILRLQKMCLRKVRVKQCNEADYQKILENESVAKYVNTLVPHDYKDSVRELEFEEIETF